MPGLSRLFYLILYFGNVRFVCNVEPYSGCCYNTRAELYRTSGSGGYTDTEIEGETGEEGGEAEKTSPDHDQTITIKRRRLNTVELHYRFTRFFKGIGFVSTGVFMILHDPLEL